MNANEYGVIFRFSTGYDMSGFTGLSLTFTKPDASTLTVTNLSSSPVTLGSINVATTLGTFASHQYVNYTFAAGDINQAGTYTVRLTYTDSTKKLISDPATFTINP